MAREAGGLIVMPSNASGWFWHSLARETGRLGHLYSPGGQRGPWPWLPYALDNGAFSCWDKDANTFDDGAWWEMSRSLTVLWNWALWCGTPPLWVVVPDVPGNAGRTIERWAEYAPRLARWPRALAVQDGMTVADAKQLDPMPDVIAIGGTDEFKWTTVEKWVAAFPRVHVLRCNSPERLYELEAMGVESCDGTGWNRGNKTQTAGLERWARSKAKPITTDLTPFLPSGGKRNPKQRSFYEA